MIYVNITKVKFINTKEFDYKLNYKKLDFTEVRKIYEQGITCVPYTDDICKYWKFKTPFCKKCCTNIFNVCRNDFVGMDMCRKFLEMVLHD